MARINTNISSMISQRNLARTSADLAMRLQRLSTVLRINRGADDPAGLIVSERLRSEIKGISQAIANSERASSVIATTEGYLAEAADLLLSMKALIVGAANTGGVSREEIEANQLQVDSAIDSITRISNTASFAGLQLLNGSMEYLTSGIPASAIAGVNIFSAQFGNNSTIDVNVEVVSSAVCRLAPRQHLRLLWYVLAVRARLAWFQHPRDGACQVWSRTRTSFLSATRKRH